VDDGVTGYLFRPGEAEVLTEKVRQFIRLPIQKKS
jgi:hypothetical protein